jgi:hypothetical protein
MSSPFYTRNRTDVSCFYFWTVSHIFTEHYAFI